MCLERGSAEDVERKPNPKRLPGFGGGGGGWSSELPVLPVLSAINGRGTCGLATAPAT